MQVIPLWDSEKETKHFQIALFPTNVFLTYNELFSSVLTVCEVRFRGGEIR
jgi:hypothetical protein